MATERVVAYIDGFNLYYGLREARLRSSRWLDLRALCESLVKPHQRLCLVRYFTTRVRNNPRAAQRQGVFIDALRASGGIEIDYGHFLDKTVTCKSCRSTRRTAEEKKTDVNIAVRLLDDAFDDRFDVAMLISADSDLAPPIESVRRRFPQKTVLVASPPRRWSSELQRAANATIRIADKNIRSNRLPDPVIAPDGTTLRAPPGWLPVS